ncbi:MAG: phosphate acetyltransferase, partial [Verrucomicrobia bacterium]|nr:phosphate acetyltransferase [Verrucomicrobiota bacterium]
MVVRLARVGFGAKLEVMATSSLFLSIAEKLVRHPKRIVFPEGTNPQVVRAAARYAHLRLGPVVLLGQPDLIRRQAKMQKVDLDRVMVLDPVEGQDRQMFKDHLRSEPGGVKLKLSAIDDYISDPIVYGTLMLRFGQVDGLVAGVGAYSGSVLRPLIRMIPRLPHISRISSATILECPDKTIGDGGLLVAGDAAVVPSPAVEELASTAVGLARLKMQITGRRARVGLLSYSTKGSAALSAETGKVIQAVKKAQALAERIGLRADFDGEMQIDAALDPLKAKLKAAGSVVAGRADCLVFPDLNSGNIAIKSIQRFGSVKTYGNILLGLRLPAAEISRGADEEEVLGVAAIIGLLAV